MRFVIVTRFRVGGKQTRIISKPKTLPEAASYEEFPPGNHVYCLDSVYASLPGTFPTLESLGQHFSRTWNTRFCPDCYTKMLV